MTKQYRVNNICQWYNGGSLQTQVTQYIYLLAERYKILNLKVVRNCSSVLLSGYDGPGIKSLPISDLSSFNSSAFILLLVVTKSDIHSHCQKYARTTFMAIDTTNTVSCYKEHIDYKEQKLVMQFVWNSQTANKHCKWQLNNTSGVLSGTTGVYSLYIQSYSFEGPETLLEGHDCSYGGVFIYTLLRNIKQLVWSSCKEHLLLYNKPSLFESGFETQLFVVGLSFLSYSNLKSFSAYAIAERSISEVHHITEEKTNVSLDINTEKYSF